MAAKIGVRSCTYDEQKECLEVTFTTGQTLHYRDVDRDTANKIVSADRNIAAQLIQNNIVGRHWYKKRGESHWKHPSSDPGRR